MAALTLLLVGAYGRFTGSFPTSPYATASAVQDASPLVEVVLADALAAAQRAVAVQAATPGQAAGVAAASRHGTHADRSHAFAQATTVGLTR